MEVTLLLARRFSRRSRVEGNTLVCKWAERFSRVISIKREARERTRPQWTRAGVKPARRNRRRSLAVGGKSCGDSCFKSSLGAANAGVDVGVDASKFVLATSWNFLAPLGNRRTGNAELVPDCLEGPKHRYKVLRLHCVRVKHTSHSVVKSAKPVNC